MPRVHLHDQFQLKNGKLIHFLRSSSPYGGNSQKQSNSSSSASSGSRISPILLFIIVLLAVIFFICGLLHLLVRFLIRKRSDFSSESERNPEPSDSDAYRRQLQQLFHLHDSGLDQALIDALPVFLYKEIVGSKEPFDCAVCLCEFLEDDKLRLLPMCSHAFHIDCIDTWLLSNSTCPLCRGSLFTPGYTLEYPAFDFGYSPEEDGFSGQIRGNGVSPVQKPVAEKEITSGKRVFSVRLGKFRNINGGGEGGETSGCLNSNLELDARRCYSMGSYQYIVAESDLVVALCASGGGVKRLKGESGENESSSCCSVEGDNAEGKKINIRCKGESFSVSKVWLWSNKKKGRFPNPSDSHLLGSSSSSGTAVGLALNGRRLQGP